MNLPRYEWYTVDELAEYWKVPVSQINRYIDSFDLTLSYLYTHPESRDCWIDHSEEGKKLTYKLDHEELLLEHYELKGAYIKLEEAIRFEEMHAIDLPGNKPDYLNPDHPLFSTELSDAVTAWKRAARMEPDPRKFKDSAKKWLKKAGYEGAALDRIAVVVNPDKGKAGGAPKMK